MGIDQKGNLSFVAVLMGRNAKRNKMFLAGAAVWLLVMHWVDHYWLVMPQYDPSGLTTTFSPIVDIACTIGMVALFVAMFCLIARNRPLVALKDPRLAESLNYEVH